MHRFILIPDLHLSKPEHQCFRAKIISALGKMAFLKIFFGKKSPQYISSLKKKKEIRQIFSPVYQVSRQTQKQEIVGCQYLFDFLNYSIKRKHWQTKRRNENWSTINAPLACTQLDFLSAKLLAVVRLWEEPSRP